MSRIFFDAMLFVYLLEDHPQHAPEVRQALQRCYERSDTLLSSCLAIGEFMAGWRNDERTAQEAVSTIREMGFGFIPFDNACMPVFARLRAEMQLKAPDAIHLACAAAAGTDLFLTGDKPLLNRRLHVPGIQFIAHFGMGVL